MRVAWLLFIALLPLLPLRTAVSQTERPFPEMDELRAWLQEHHPNLIRGDSGVNAAVVVVDTNGHYVKSTAFRLTAGELAVWSGGVAESLRLQDDSVAANLVWACQTSRTKRPTAAPPMCVLDGVRVQAFEGLRFLASRGLEILEGEAAVKRFGPNAANGAVLLTTDTVALSQFASVGATPENFIMFSGRRISRRADGQPVVLTILMLRRASKGPEL